MRRIVALVVALGGVGSVSILGCDDMPDDTCIARGTRTNIHAAVTTTLTAQGGMPVVATTDDTLIVDDYTHACTYDQEEFPVTILGCRVYVRLEPADNHKDETDPVPGVVVGGQACTLALPQGPTRVSVGAGRLSFPGGVVTFALDGAVGAVNGVSTLGTVSVALVAD